MKKYNEIQLTKNNINLNNRKMKNHPPSSDTDDAQFIDAKAMHQEMVGHLGRQNLIITLNWTHL